MDKSIDPRRAINLEGTVNTRDIGGYQTADGRTTRWGQLIRSDAPVGLSERDQARLLDLGLKTTLDLRKSRDIQSSPNVFFGSDSVTYYHQNMVGDTYMREREPGNIPSGLEYVEFMRWQYSVVLDRRRSHIQDTLSLLAVPGTLPSLIHCAGGTERTGLIIGLVLGMLGVPEDTIAEDFALTAEFTYESHLERNPSLDRSSYTLADHQAKHCRPDTMIAVLRTLQERYTGVIGYVRHIGVSDDEIHALRDALLE